MILYWILKNLYTLRDFAIMQKSTQGRPMTSHKKHKKNSPYKKGIPAGSAIYIGDTAPSHTQMILTYFDEKQGPLQIAVEPDTLEEALKKHANRTAWLSVEGLENTELIHQIGEILHVHPLVTEDLLNTEHLSKIEFFSDYIFLISKLFINQTPEKPMKIEQFSFIIKHNLLVTFQEEHDAIILHTLQKMREFTLGELVYCVIDGIIDNDYMIIEEKGELLEEYEEKIVKNKSNINLGDLYTTKRDLLRLRKKVISLNNILSLLIREKSPLLNTLPEIYISDLQDHLLRISEAIDIHYELSTNILQVYLSSLSNKTNETMKVLTLFAAIFIPLSFIAGVFGMNFTNMPGVHWEWGYITTIGGMTALAIGLLVFFKKKGWV